MFCNVARSIQERLAGQGHRLRVHSFTTIPGLHKGRLTGRKEWPVGKAQILLQVCCGGGHSSSLSILLTLFLRLELLRQATWCGCPAWLSLAQGSSAVRSMQVCLVPAHHNSKQPTMCCHPPGRVGKAASKMVTMWGFSVLVTRSHCVQWLQLAWLCSPSARLSLMQAVGSAGWASLGSRCCYRGNLDLILNVVFLLSL